MFFSLSLWYSYTATLTTERLLADTLAPFGDEIGQGNIDYHFYEDDFVVPSSDSYCGWIYLIMEVVCTSDVG